MIRSVSLAASLAFAMALTPMSVSAADYVPLERRLTADQMRTTGLDQLTADQLASLNAILASDAAARPAPAASAVAADASRDPIEGRIVGRFEGWTTGTVFTLDTGSRWRVTEGSFDTRAVENPKATIKPGLFSGWYLYVEGQPVVAKVKRVR